MKLTASRLSGSLIVVVLATAVAWTTAPGAQGSSGHGPVGPATTQPYDPSLHTAVSDCPTTKTDFVSEENPIPGTTNQSPINPTQVLGMTKSVRVGGTTASCVIVDVTAIAFADARAQDGEVMYLTVYMDGFLGHPAEVQFTANDDRSGGTRAANFVFKKANPGVHTVSMKFWTAFGSEVFIGQPTMQILHN